MSSYNNANYGQCEGMPNFFQFAESFFNLSHSGILSFDQNYRYTFWNPSMEKITGKMKDEVIGKVIFEVFPQLSGTPVETHLGAALSGKIIKCRNKIKNGQGLDLYYEGCYYPIFSSSNDVIGGIAVLNDLTEIVKTEEALKQSNELLKENELKLFETQKLAKMGYWEKDFIHDKLEWSDNLKTQLYEFSSDTHADLNLFKSLIYKDDKELFEEKLEEILNGGNQINYEVKIITPNGNLKHIYSSSKKIFDENGKLQRLIGYSQDISKQKRAELFIKSALDNCFHAIGFIKPIWQEEEIIDFECILLNQIALTLIGQGSIESNYKGKWLTRDLYFNDKESGLFKHMVQAFKTGEPFERDHYYSRFNKWFTAKACTLEDGLLIAFADITDAKLKEEQLRILNSELEDKISKRTAELYRQAEQLTVLANSIPQLVFIQSNNVPVYLNDKWSDFCGFNKDEITDEKFWDLMHPDDLPEAGKIWSEAVKQKKEFICNYRLRRYDGEYVWFMTKAIPLKDASGEIEKWFGTCTDIDLIKQTEKSIALQALVLRNMGEGVCVADKDGYITYVNEAFYKMFGYESGELIGQQVFVLNEQYEGSEAYINNALDIIFTTGSWTGEIRNIKKDKTLFTTYSHINTVLLDGEIHLIAVQDDITEIKHNQRLLEESSDNIKKLYSELSLKNKELLHINNDLDNFIYTTSLTFPMFRCNLL